MTLDPYHIATADHRGETERQPATVRAITDAPARPHCIVCGRRITGDLRKNPVDARCCADCTPPTFAPRRVRAGDVDEPKRTRGSCKPAEPAQPSEVAATLALCDYGACQKPATCRVEMNRASGVSVDHRPACDDHAPLIARLNGELFLSRIVPLEEQEE